MDGYGFQGQRVCFSKKQFYGKRNGAKLCLVLVASPSPLRVLGFEEERKEEEYSFARALVNSYGDCEDREDADGLAAGNFYGFCFWKRTSCWLGS